MKENVKASARFYFEGYPGSQTVIVTDDGHCFHAKHAGAARIHCEKAGVGMTTVGRKMLSESEPKPEVEEKPKGKTKPAGTVKPEGEKKPEGEDKPEGEKKPEGEDKPEGEKKPEGEEGAEKQEKPAEA